MSKRSFRSEVLFSLNRIEERLNRIEANQDQPNTKIAPLQIPEIDILILPDHIRKSYVIVAKKGECDALTVSHYTHRARAVESAYLNQLVCLGWLTERRQGKKKLFHVLKEVKQYQTQP